MKPSSDRYGLMAVLVVCVIAALFAALTEARAEGGSLVTAASAPVAPRICCAAPSALHLNRIHTNRQCRRQAHLLFNKSKRRGRSPLGMRNVMRNRRRNPVAPEGVRPWQLSDYRKPHDSPASRARPFIEL